MRAAAISLIAFVAAFPAVAGETDVASRIDAVTIYPDAAIVTRLAEVDAPAGDSVLTFRNLPLGLDPRVAARRGRGRRGADHRRGRDARRASRSPPSDDALTAKIAELRQQRAATQTTIDALQGKRAMIVRFSQSGPEKLSPESKPLDVADWSAAWDAVGTALAKVSAELTPALEKARELDEQIAALEAQKQAPRPEAARRIVTVAVNAAAAARASLSLSYRVAGVGWTPLYDAALKTDEAGGPSMTSDPPRRHLAVDRRGLERRRADRVDGAGRARRRCRRSAGTADRLLAAGGRRNRPSTARRRRRRRRRRAGRQGRSRRGAAGPGANATEAPPPAPIAAEDAAAQLQASAYTAAFKAAGRVTLASDGSQKSFVLGRVVVQPTLSVKTAPSVDPTAYVEAHFVDSEDAPILPGRGGADPRRRLRRRRPRRLRRARRRRRSRLRRRRQGQGRPRAGEPQGERADLVQSDQDRDARVRHQRQEPARLPGQGAGDRPHADVGEHGDRRRARACDDRRRPTSRSATSAG